MRSASYVCVAAGWVADSEIDRQFDPADPEAGLELPALAFCLLFRFQGAEALARALSWAVDPNSAEVPCAFPVGNPPVRRSKKITTAVTPHNPSRENSWRPCGPACDRGSDLGFRGQLGAVTSTM